MEDPQFSAVAATGALASDEVAHELLQSIVDVARAIFAAKAATIFLLDLETEELVFEAVSGTGSELVGQRLPADTGVAGWVLVTRQPLVIEDLLSDPRFAHDVAEDVGYVPQGLMAVPLLRGDNPLGVLEVLDRPRRPEFSLDEIELLSLFAHQAAIALDLLRHARRSRDALAGRDDTAVVARLAAAVIDPQDPRREENVRFLESLERLLSRGGSPR